MPGTWAICSSTSASLARSALTSPSVATKWEPARGGPVARAQAIRRYPDFMFPQMAQPDLAPPDWAPNFFDYLYVSFTNATAFSPTDTMPLTAWRRGEWDVTVGGQPLQQQPFFLTVHH